MELEELIRGIPRFNEWTHPAKLRLFGWYLHSQRSMDRFEVSDIRGCYDALSMERPSNISQSLASLSQKVSREILRDGRGWYLERKIRGGLDFKYGQRAATVQVHKLLQELPGKLANTAERAYLDEALICFTHRAYRAAVVMSWNLAFDHLCEHILRHRLADFNLSLPIRFPKAEINKLVSRDDLTQLKESQVIEVCRTADITPPNVHRILKEKLDKRNLAAHPSGIGFNQLQVEEYISDLIQNVVLKVG